MLRGREESEGNFQLGLLLFKEEWKKKFLLLFIYANGFLLSSCQDRGGRGGGDVEIGVTSRGGRVFLARVKESVRK